MPVVNVKSPGFLTTIQDLGRPGYAHLGVSASGPADSVALRLGNLLVGNDENTPALELTLVGGAFEFESNTVVAITGSDFEPTCGGQPVPLWTSYFVRAGDRLEFGATKSGARCYVCVRGGIECPRVLGSASTHVLTGIGGLNGRALQRGDILRVGTANANGNYVPHTVSQEILRHIQRSGPLRITRGPQASYFTDEAHSTLSSSAYVVSEESNRMGLRLTGPLLKRTREKEMITEGVSLGAIQVPQNGQPIILFVEHQTTGGYPKIANVISADLHRVGQLRPRDEVRFETVPIDIARSLLREQEALIHPHSLQPV
jgi:antagonist of KipI